MPKMLTERPKQKTQSAYKAAKAVNFRIRQTKTPSDALEPYNWGPKGEPKGQPFTFVPGEGWKIG